MVIKNRFPEGAGNLQRSFPSFPLSYPSRRRLPLPGQPLFPLTARASATWSESRERLGVRRSQGAEQAAFLSARVSKQTRAIGNEVRWCRCPGGGNGTRNRNGHGLNWPTQPEAKTGSGVFLPPFLNPRKLKTRAPAPRSAQAAVRRSLVARQEPGNARRRPPLPEHNCLLVLAVTPPCRARGSPGTVRRR